MTLGRKKLILDEDKYLDDLEFIIKRDFFPDSELLELQLKYYDSIESQDFSAIKEIQMKLNRINEVFDNCKTVESTPKGDLTGAPYKNPNITEERDLHLNEYLARNTSEDNDSYTDLQQKTIERQINKLSWSFKAAKEYNDSRFKLLENKSQLSITNGETQLSLPKSNIDKFLEYKVFNPVFFNPDSVPLSAEERVSLANKKSEIIYENTRFKTPFATLRSRPKTNQNKAKIPGKIGHDGKELSSNSTPRVGGYSILARTDTPESIPTPTTTWGEIDGTPIQIPDSPMISQFRIQEPSEREKLANEMASRAARKNKNKKQLALERVKSNLNRPTSSRSYVSPAAIKLLSRMTPSTPKSIMSSRPNSIFSSVHKNTPSVDRYSSAGTPNNRTSITDNLLDL